MEPKTGRPLFIGVGELLWDMLPAGKQLGGAPANFSYHAQALGAESLVVSRVGNDALGRESLEQLQRCGLRTDAITVDPLAPTGTVSVLLDNQGKPAFTIHEHVAWDFLEIGQHIRDEAGRADVLCFGSLAQRSPVSRAAIRALLAVAPAAALRIFDINLRQHFWSRDIVAESLESANVFKLNDDELPVVAGLFGLEGDEFHQLSQLAERFSLRAVALTKGAQGSSLLIDGTLVSRPGSELRIVDTVGAGDGYTAGLAFGLLGREEPSAILARAHRVADFVCTQPGAMPQYPVDSPLRL